MKIIFNRVDCKTFLFFHNIFSYSYIHTEETKVYIRSSLKFFPKALYIQSTYWAQVMLGDTRAKFYCYSHSAN